MSLNMSDDLVNRAITFHCGYEALFALRIFATAWIAAVPKLILIIARQNFFGKRA